MEVGEKGDETKTLVKDKTKEEKIITKENKTKSLEGNLV